MPMGETKSRCPLCSGEERGNQSKDAAEAGTAGTFYSGWYFALKHILTPLKGQFL